MSYPTIPTLPTPPNRGMGQSEFSEAADSFLSALPNQQSSMNSMASWMQDQAETTEYNSNAALSASQDALATSSYKGEWSSLTGSLSIPSSVYHKGIFWRLNSPLVSVGSSEPGVTRDWTPIINPGSLRVMDIDSPVLKLFSRNIIESIPGSSLTYTRASSASYINMYGFLEEVGNDIPRKEREGWLVEGASTNEIATSDSPLPGDPSWAYFGSPNITASLSTDHNSPKGGGESIVKLVKTVVDDSRIGTIISAGGASVGDPLTLSCFSRVGINETLRLQWVHYSGGVVKSGSAFFDLNTGTLTSVDSGFKAGVLPVGRGWQRFWISSEVEDELNTSFRLDVSQVGTNDIYLFGYQAELLEYCTSYITNSGVKNTRLGDVISLDNLGIVPLLSKGVTILFRAKVSSDALQPRYLLSIETNPGFKADIVMNTTGMNSRFGSSIVQNIEVPYGEDFQVAFTAIDGLVKRYLNGAYAKQTILDFDGDILSSGKLRIGLSQADAQPFYGHITHFQLFDFVLNDQEIYYLTRNL